MPRMVTVKNDGWRFHILACLAVASVGCASTVPRELDTPKPEQGQGVADFSALFDNGSVSRSVYAMDGTQSSDRESMSQVLLSPNLVFEASRSSVDEPATLGPAGAALPAPDLDDALGKPIPVAASSVLLEYLVHKGSVLIAPVTSTKWQPTCAPGSPICPQTTWVERLMLASPQAPEVTPRAGGMPALPTVAFAVRELGLSTIDLPVVATREGDKISFRPRRSLSEKSVCGDVNLLVPVVVFSAEIVSAHDGRLLARIHEQRSPEIDVAQESAIDLVTWKAVERVAYTRTSFIGHEPDPSSRYSYVRKWRKRDVHCDRSLRAYEEIQRKVEEAMRMQLPATVGQILTDSIEQLYPAAAARAPAAKSPT